MCFGSSCFYRYRVFLVMSTVCLVGCSLMKVFDPLRFMPYFSRAVPCFLLRSLILMFGRLASMLLQSKSIPLCCSKAATCCAMVLISRSSFSIPFVLIQCFGDNRVIHACMLFQNFVKSRGNNTKITNWHATSSLLSIGRDKTPSASGQGSPCFRQQPLLSISINLQMIFFL